MIDEAVSEQLFKDIDYIEQQIADNYNKDNENSRNKKKEVSEKINTQIEAFLKVKICSQYLNYPTLLIPQAY